MKRSGTVAFLLAVMLLAGFADPVAELDYQGKVLISDVPFTGEGYFKFAFSDDIDSSNYWSNDGTASGEPGAPVTNSVYNGVFSVTLGAPPMSAIAPDIFSAGTDLYLRVWFSDDNVTFNEMLPAQRLVSSPYAINADQVDGYDADELIAAATNGVSLSGDVSGSPGGGTTVGSLQGDALDLGSASSGDVLTWDGSAWTNIAGGISGQAASNAFVLKTGDTMTGALTINDAGSSSLRIGSSYATVAVGSSAVGGTMGVAVGYNARSDDYGVGVGYRADGSLNGTAVGYDADASGTGTALGQSAKGTNGSIAIGIGAQGTGTNIVVGYNAEVGGGLERIAIGHNVTNDVNNTARIRGTFYMDGGTGLVARPVFGTGGWKTLLPLPPLDNVVYVATNGTAAGPGTIDRPFDTPQNGYNYAAARYAGHPAALVIAGGRHAGLVMGAGNVHVLGQSRPQLDSLLILSGSSSIMGKQRVENIIVERTAIVAADGGAEVKFHNCRFAGGLSIQGPSVEVQDCYATGNDGPAVVVGTGASPISEIAIYNSSIYNKDASNPALLVNQQVYYFEVIGCEIVNFDPTPGVSYAYAAIQDEELALHPSQPPHLYSHNVIRGAEHGAPYIVPAVYDPQAQLAQPTMTFVHNTVWGDVGVSNNVQFFANNIVYGQMNNVGGPIGWTQAGVGTGTDPAGNTEHQGNYPQQGAAVPGRGFPAAWQD